MNLPENKSVVLFDGVCNLCNKSVRFIIKYDANDVFRFASIQSAIGQQIIKLSTIDLSKMDSIILYEPNIGFSIKSKAAFKIAEKLNGLVHFSSYFRILGTTITDFFYDIVAKKRYHWFGKTDTCELPKTEISYKFLN